MPCLGNQIQNCDHCGCTFLRYGSSFQSAWTEMNHCSITINILCWIFFKKHNFDWENRFSMLKWSYLLVLLAFSFEGFLQVRIISNKRANVFLWQLLKSGILLNLPWSSIPAQWGISTAWGFKEKMLEACVLKVVLDSVTPWTIAHQTPVAGIFQARILEQVAISYFKLSSVQSLMSDSWRPHELQHTRPPCPSPTAESLPKPRSIPSVMPSNHLILCHPLLPSTFPNIRVFSMSQLFTSGGQSIGVSPSTSVLPVNIQGGFPLGRTG